MLLPYVLVPCICLLVTLVESLPHKRETDSACQKTTVLILGAGIAGITAAVRALPYDIVLYTDIVLASA